MTLAMGGRRPVCRVSVPVQVVMAAFGLVTIGAGLAGLLVPAVRDA